MGWRIFRPVGTIVCFLSNELIENETEFEEDTLDLVREDEMKVKLLTIYFNQLWSSSGYKICKNASYLSESIMEII